MCVCWGQGRAATDHTGMWTVAEVTAIELEPILEGSHSVIT